MAQTEADWITARGFIKQFITVNLKVGFDQVRVAVVTYDSNSATVRFNFTRFSTEDDVKYAIDQILYSASGNADVTKAINVLSQSVFVVRIDKHK